MCVDVWVCGCVGVCVCMGGCVCVCRCVGSSLCVCVGVWSIPTVHTVSVGFGC